MSPARQSRIANSLPWLLLSLSVAGNVVLWQRATPATPAPSSSFALSQGASPQPPAPPPPSSPALSSPLSALDSSPSSIPAALLPPRTTAERTAAFRGYAELLSEDVKTQEQITALNQLLARWVATDPTAAATWLAQHDDAPFYDPAALHIAKHLVAAERFSEATTWADLILDPALREDAREAIVAESFRAKKMDAATVRLSGLPAPRIEAILNGSRLD